MGAEERERGVEAKEKEREVETPRTGGDGAAVAAQQD
jgi:hypothetical protein